MFPWFSTLIFSILFYTFYKRNTINPNLAITLMLLVIIVLYMVYRHAERKHNPHHVAKGKEISKYKRVIMATCLRDSEYSMESIELLYMKFSSIFKEVKLVVLENNSKDNTRAKLLELKKNKIPNMDVIGCGLNKDYCDLKLNNIRSGISSARIRRMAKIRNIILEYIKTIQKDYDFCFMFDGDIIIEEFENEGIYDTMYHFENDKTIDAIAANTYQDFGEVYKKFYDFYAFSSFGGTKISFWGYYFNRNNLIKVRSAFNGFVFYRLPFTDEIKYDENTNTCEHIGFHSQLNNMYVNQNFMIEIIGH